jgi:hypothetical protein
MENFSPNLAHKGTVKENVMKNFEGFESAVEGILISATLGLSLPLAVAFTEKLAFAPSDAAVFLVIVHSLTATTHAVMHELGGGAGTKVINHLYYGLVSALVGAGMYRCLADSFTVTVDFSSVSAVVIIGCVTALSFAVSAAMVKLMENK